MPWGTHQVRPLGAKTVLVLGSLSLLAAMWLGAHSFHSLWERSRANVREQAIVECLERELTAATRPGQKVSVEFESTGDVLELLMGRSAEILYPRVNIVEKSADVELAVSEAPWPQGCTVRVLRPKGR